MKALMEMIAGRFYDYKNFEMSQRENFHMAIWFLYLNKFEFKLSYLKSQN